MSPEAGGHRRGNRPHADDVVRHLGDYFPDHDLDQPVVLSSSSADDLTDSVTPALNFGNNNYTSEDQDTPIPGPSTSQHRMRNISSSRLSQSRPTNFNSLSFSQRPGRATNTNSADPRILGALSGPHTQDENNISSPATSLGGGGRLGYTKSIRRLAEEQVRRQSNPGSARRQTFWDFKMEELKKLPPTPVSGQQRPPFIEDDH
jgi:hypothetical protein